MSPSPLPFFVLPQFVLIVPNLSPNFSFSFLLARLPAYRASSLLRLPKWLENRLEAQDIQSNFSIFHSRRFRALLEVSIQYPSKFQLVEIEWSAIDTTKVFQFSFPSRIQPHRFFIINLPSRVRPPLTVGSEDPDNQRISK
jgi:hypothetical protein